MVLDTDYVNYAVIWSCSNVTPLGHTESAWVSVKQLIKINLLQFFIQKKLMTRERSPRGEVLQAAYGVLDKFKMNRSFFVKTDQEKCETLPPPQEADPLRVKISATNEEAINVVDNKNDVVVEATTGA